MRIENAKAKLEVLPVSLELIRGLRESAQLQSTHFSTFIEGNRLTQDEVDEVVCHKGHFPGRERDEREVLGYYAALKQLEEWIAADVEIKVEHIQKLHGLVMGSGKKRVKKTPFRDGQNVIRDSRDGSIVYLPPEAKDVQKLMNDLVVWLKTSNSPAPIKAAIAHYQFATVHPYYDGNGRCARLLAALVLHLEDYGLNGLFSLEEYYARDLMGYYKAIAIGPSHNYYMGRADADITSWIEYFCVGLSHSFERVLESAKKASPKDEAALLLKMDAKQRRLLSMIDAHAVFTSLEIAKLFQISPRTARGFCKKWVDEGFLSVVDVSKKNRRYRIKI